jgi:hypothetical protein
MRSLAAMLSLAVLVPAVGHARVSDPNETPGPHIATAPLPLAGPDALPQAAGRPHLLYINFDGAVLRRGCGNDSRHDCSTLADLFDGYVGPFVGDEGRRVSIVQAVRKDLAEFGVRAVTTRPAAETGYTMVLYGDLGTQDFAGIAPYIDCGNLWPNDTCFAGAFQGSNIGSTIILQEAAHTWGLEHVNAPFDNLHPFVAAATPSFTDACNKIVANTDLVETGGVCNLVHEKYCEAGYQNSHRELLYLFGPAVPDTVAPTLEISSPLDGSVHVLPTTIPLLGEVTDDLSPQFYDITITRDGQQLYETEAIKLVLDLANPPAGEYDLEVVVVDDGGNKGKDRVRFTVLPAGSEDPDTDSDAGESATDSETGGAEDSGCRVAGPPSDLGPLACLVPLAWLARRRRPRY